MSQRFFGHPESPLFGVYHPPRGKSSGLAKAVVICPPIGQEFNRTHWSIRLLANQLARTGIHVLRFDYHGIGDSAGSIEQIDSLEVWHQDICQAIDHLKHQSNAASVMLVGQRFGATLAGQVAAAREDVNSLVLWEPILEGKQYFDLLRSLHAQMLDLWVCKMSTPSDENFEEILGSLYSRRLMTEIEELYLDPSRIKHAHLIIDSTESGNEYSHEESSLQKVVRETYDESWGDLRVLETARLQPKTTRLIVKAIADMFVRLQKYTSLASVGVQNA